MSAKMLVIAKSRIPVRNRRSLEPKYIATKKKKQIFIEQGDQVEIIAVDILGGVKYGELKNGKFVVLERDGFSNFE